MTLTPASGFPYYISLTKDLDYTSLFLSRANFDLLESISEQQSSHRYAIGKWSIKQIVGHMADHERIMIYRALRFSRKDSTELPGYDQNPYVANARFDDILFTDLVQDFRNVRTASISFLTMLSEEQLAYKGTASRIEISVEDLLKATAGHEIHHMRVLKERYLGERK
jgi:uncharacterized damage-inducible protein DinB